MKIHYFTMDELVSFGNYLLSEARTEVKMQHPEFNQEQKEESLKQVSHADVANWFDTQTVELAVWRKKDAALISAAPDMLEALQNLENDDNSIPEHAWKMVQDAIRKATDVS